MAKARFCYPHFWCQLLSTIYTGLTRAKKLAVFVGSRKAFAMAVGQIDNRKRQTALTDLIELKALELVPGKSL